MKIQKMLSLPSRRVTDVTHPLQIEEVTEVTKKDEMRGKTKRATGVYISVNEDCKRGFNDADRFLRKFSYVMSAVLTGFLLITTPVLTAASHTKQYEVVNEEINPVILTETAFKALSIDEQEAVSTQWGLTSEQYQRYLSEMQSGPSSLWYKDLDPAEVLLINARNDEELNHYADIVVKLTHDRGERELAAQKAYHEAWQRLYPDLRKIKLNAVTEGVLPI